MIFRDEALTASLPHRRAEFVAVQDLFTIRNGYTPPKSNVSYWTNGTIPWFRMDDIRTNGRVLSDSLQHITESAVKGGTEKLFPANSLLIATTATIGEHALITIPHLANQQFTSLTLRPEFRNHVNIKFAYYCCFLLAEWCKNNTSISSFPSVDMKGFRLFKLPIPDLREQHRIVEILDTFTQLEAELEARRKQYAHYLC